ncbi:hypothetical protein CLOM_g13618 [Closterium sp. NIES-68]|nr:hypothetical protein CLOM_g13618 [Closterium sp. NIES-68]GJP77111.1 hypothetical protein CLOP_g7550 [Closterium sp. NIES-67]
MASTGSSPRGPRGHNRSSSASFRSLRELAVTPAQQFVVLSQPTSPAKSHLAPNTSPRGGALPERATCGESSTSDPAILSRPSDSAPARHSERRLSESDAPAGRSSYGLSLQQLQHLTALTAANDGPRGDTLAAFPYSASPSGPGGSRLSMASSQRRLDLWNRAREPTFGNTLAHIRAQQRLKRTRSEPSLQSPARGVVGAGGMDEGELGGSAGERSGSRRAQRSATGEAILAEAWRQAFRRSLRRSRSAHALGEKDTAALWKDAMTALIWRRGGAFIYRRPDGPQPSGAAGSPVDNTVASKSRNRTPPPRSPRPVQGSNRQVGQVGQATATASSRASYAVTSAISPPAISPLSSPLTASSGTGRYPRHRRTPSCPVVPGGEALLGDGYEKALPSTGRLNQDWQQQEQAARDPVKSVFAWAAEQRIASRRAESAQQH